MTALLLATLLNASAGISLVDNPGARHVVLVSDDEKPAKPIDSREGLLTELKRIDDSRPGLGGPVALLAVGVALVIPGLAFSVAGITGLITTTQLASTMMRVGYIVAGSFTGVGAVLIVVGAILATVGGVSLGARIRARSANGKEADEVRRKLDALDTGVPLPVPAPADPGPQTNFVNPGGMQTVFSF